MNNEHDDVPRPVEEPRLQLVNNPPQAIRPSSAVPKPPIRQIGNSTGVPPAPNSTPPPRMSVDDPYDDYGTPPDYYKHKRSPLWKILGSMVAIVLIAAAAYYWFFMRTDDSQTARTTQSTTSKQPTPAAKNQFASQTKTYSATNFSISFAYPADWTVTETAGTGVLTVRSPAVTLKDASGTTKQGQAILTIRDKQQALAEFDDGNAVAALTSEKITYKQPSSVQRGSTYISFLRYASTVGAEGIDGVYITGDTGYQADQAIPKADFASVDPIISLTFEVCDGACAVSGQKHLSLAASAWQDTLLSGPLSTILTSLVII